MSQASNRAEAARGLGGVGHEERRVGSGPRLGGRESSAARHPSQILSEGKVPMSPWPRRSPA